MEEQSRAAAACGGQIMINIETYATMAWIGVQKDIG